MATLKKISDYTQVSTVLGTEKVLVEKAAGGYGFIAASDLITTDWTKITVGKPTTLAGYGITDAVGSSDARLTDARTPVAHNQAWSTITDTPTTLSGYGITDAASFPTQTGQSGKFLTTDGSVVSWGTPAGGGGGSGDTAATPNTLAQRDSNGDLYAVNFISTSDIAVKDNISSIANPLELILGMTGHQFRVRGTQQDSFGFLAQEIEQVLPTVVHTDADGFKSVNYTAVIGILVEAIKELSSKIRAGV